MTNSNRRPYTFDLEVGISTWRGVFSRRNAISAEDLNELEHHLRDETAAFEAEGMDPETAFRTARAKVGNVVVLDEAYQSVYWQKKKHRQQLIPAVRFQLGMYKSYAAMAVRGMLKSKGFSFLNILGLSVGLACSFLILIWIQHEFGIDQFHETKDRLFQVKIDDHRDASVLTWTNVPLPLAEVLKQDFPEVEHAVLTLPIKARFSSGAQASREIGYFASPAFFEAFSFPVLEGSAQDMLKNPAQIAISESFARKHFGRDWHQDGQVVGTVVSLDLWQSNGGVLGEAITVTEPTEFVVSGVFDSQPEHSSLQLDFVLPVSIVLSEFQHLSSWGPRWFELFVLLDKNAENEGVQSKISSVISQFDETAHNQQLQIQPFNRTYLQGHHVNGVPSGGRMDRLILMALVGLSILLLACINFTNLVTARSHRRSREIGVRKAVGATPSYLVQQFLGEAVLTSLVALGGAFVLMAFLFPTLREVTQTSVSISQLSLWNWTTFVGIAIFTGILSGLYPAFYLSSMNVVKVFRNRTSQKRKGALYTRKGLVIFQFAVTVMLVFGTLTVYQQLQYLQNKDLGINADNVAVVQLDGDMGVRFEAVRDKLMSSNAFRAVSRSSEHPLGVAIANSNINWEGKEDGSSVLFKVLYTDEQFGDTVDLRLVAGRFFDKEQDQGKLHYVVNEAAVAALGLENPIGHPFAFGFEVEGTGTGLGKIIGVVGDFHTGSLVEQEIGPLVFRYEPEASHLLLARFIPGSTTEGIDVLSGVNAEFNSGYPLEYSFMDDTAGKYYQDEYVLSMLSRVFAVVALFIAALGLLGLSAYSVQIRTKELGIRRAMGATKLQLMVLVAKEFILLVGIGIVLALPLAYFALHDWLTNFTYHVELGLGLPILTAIVALFIALFTVGTQAFRASNQDPSRLLRME